MERARILSVFVASHLYILLFVYAAVSKILDFENFQVQIAQSPLLTSFAHAVSWMVPAAELAIALLLSFRKTRLLGLYAGFFLMILFTIYIVIILNFSPFVPCSCGGILEKLGWEEHLIFNIIFCLVAVLGIIFQSNLNNETKRLYTPMARTFGLAIFGTAVMAVLFVASEDMVHHRNNFTRRFPTHPATLSEMMDLKVNSYYIAGQGNGNVYLGNYTAPLIVTVVDSTLKRKKQYDIKLIPARDSFYSLHLTVRMPYFYLADGRSPIVYRGIVGQWIAHVWTENTAYFNAFEPIDGQRAAFRAVSSMSRDHILGLFKVDDTTDVKVKPLLDKQTDGIFDTGGTLRYNEENGKLLYVYTYRNEYLVIDDTLESKKIQHTIDTTTKVRIKTRYDADSRERTLASPAWTVNNTARTHSKYLFVNSALMGQFEPKEMWDRASVIDVYDFMQGRYEFSFYLTHIMDSKMSDFIAGDDTIYAICGNYLAVYRLDRDFYTRKW